jgi:DNA-binding GntR family transcriptional regulator
MEEVRPLGRFPHASTDILDLMLERVAVSLLRDEAYGRLRQAILEGELAPGARLRPDELADQLGLSRMPVREALARLRDEGLVEMRPRSGTRVSPLRLDEASQALVVITAMHELAARIAVPRLHEPDLERMEAAGERFATAVRASDYEAAIAADDDFHGVFVDVAGNRAVAETLTRCMPLLRRAEALRFGTLPGKTSVAAHDQILAAARRGEVEAAVAATRGNWASLVAQIEQSIARERGDAG